MFCHKCGNQVEDGSNFCPKCGASLEAKETVVADQVPKKLRNLWAVWTLRACYLSIFSWLFSFYLFVVERGAFIFFYLLSLIAAIAAVVTGVIGLRYAKKHPESKGIISSCIGIIMGTVFVIIIIGIVLLWINAMSRFMEEMNMIQRAVGNFGNF